MVKAIKAIALYFRQLRRPWYANAEWCVNGSAMGEWANVLNRAITLPGRNWFWLEECGGLSNEQVDVVSDCIDEWGHNDD